MWRRLFKSLILSYWRRRGEAGSCWHREFFVSGIFFREPRYLRTHRNPHNCVTNTCNICLVLPRKLSSHKILPQHLVLVTTGLTRVRTRTRRCELCHDLSHTLCNPPAEPALGTNDSRAGACQGGWGARLGSPPNLSTGAEGRRGAAAAMSGRSLHRPF